MILLRKTKLGITLIIFVMIFGIFLIISPKIIFQIPTYVEFKKFPTIESLVKSFVYYEFNTLQYVSSFTLGLLSGYFVIKQPKISIGGPIIENGLNIIALVLISCIIYWSDAMCKINQTISEKNILLYFIFSKLIWSLSFTWILFVCCAGRSGKVNHIFMTN
jgi:hypothetical protein